ncbi:MAG TPA: hypothetical protein VFV67_35945 [Actinophytocola sp.]|uniref:hypothetical protein n=1 Tax=Actinophytocola sp. TaxID=1872138 RepID=UPI002DB92E3E|nr:hypothetical protein [Actinophytocola sp.]HEU5476050.1 hypothetical protein [Actinophytocola sp.]
MARAGSIVELGLSADLRARPWTYPGPALPFSCLQVGDRLAPLPAAVDQRHRHFVVGFGSNANPDVLRRKFERRGVSTTIPHVLASVADLAVGHSAHVSIPGFVPASAYPAPGSSAGGVVSLLTADQLRCLDETEPNYHRTRVPGATVRFSATVAPPAEVHLYESRWGVLADPDGSPLPFGPQETVFGRLAGWGLLPATNGGPAAIARTLAGQPELRARITRALTGHSRRYR